MYNSVHLYGADVQLISHNAQDREEAINALIEHMESVDFDPEEDGVMLFELNGAEHEAIFDYETYYQDHLNEEEDEN